MKQNFKTIFIKILQMTLITLVTFLLIAAVVWAEEHGGGRRPPTFLGILLLPRVWVSAILGIIGLLLLMKAKLNRSIRLVFLALIFFAFTIIPVLPLGKFSQGMGLHPSPMCTISKPLLFMTAGYGFPIVFLAILTSIGILTLIGNKLFCGWACPVGALQELFYNIPLSKKLKIKVPFIITNLVRIIIFIAYLVVVFAIGMNIYDFFNPFESLHWGFDFGTYILVVTIIVSLFIFRPFCYFMCPIGLFTWLLEHLSLTRVKVNKEKCTNCKTCVNLSPCSAVPAILDGKKSRPDCHACGKCLEVCPEKALNWH